MEWPVLTALLSAILVFSLASLVVHLVDGRPQPGLPRMTWHLLGAFFTVAGVEAGTLLVALHRPVLLVEHRWVLIVVYSAVAAVMASWLALRFVARRQRGQLAPVEDDPT